MQQKFPPVRLDHPMDDPTRPCIRKTRAYALLRLLAQPRFAHLRVGCSSEIPTALQ